MLDTKPNSSKPDSGPSKDPEDGDDSGNGSTGDNIDTLTKKGKTFEEKYV
ncbi:MAG: hypothetical protein KBT19_03000 [Lachnospiraceae bacterium]|nr:hypothetical protein [Candidatus Colinaster equi]